MSVGVSIIRDSTVCALELSVIIIIIMVHPSTEL